MTLFRFLPLLTLALLLASPITGLAARNEAVASRTLQIGDRLLVLAAPPRGTTDTADMPKGGILSVLEDTAVLRLRGNDLHITFESGGTVLIKSWLTHADKLRLPSGARLPVVEVRDALLSGEGRVDIASLEAAVPPDRPDRPEPTRGPLGEDATWLVAREILEPSDREPPGFRAYSYLLFANNTAAGPDFERRLAAVAAYLRQFETADAVLHRLRVEPGNVALFIALVDATWRKNDGMPDTPETVIKALMSAYDFERARLLLRRLRLPTRGPYVVSGNKPLLGGAEVQLKDLLVMDLSSVPPRLVDLWLTEFRRVAEGEYQWESGSLRRFALEVFTRLEVVGEAFSVTREAVASVLKFPK